MRLAVSATRLGVALAASAFAASAGLAADTDHSQLAGMVDEYCSGCHNDIEYRADLSFDYVNFKDLHADADIWEKVIHKLRAGAMPPRDKDQPDPQLVKTVIHNLETTLDSDYAAHPQFAPPALHRLNRNEYANAIRDLLDVNVDASGLLPADDVIGGFDNMAKALTISPALLEGYLAASAKVAARAVGNPDMKPVTVTYRVPPDESQNSYVPGAPLGTIGGIVIKYDFPLDGDYDIKPALYRHILGRVKGLQFPREADISIDKKLVHSGQFGGQSDQARSHDNAFAVADEIDGRLATRVHVTAGPHTVAVNFRRVPPGPEEEIWQQYQRTLIDSNEDKGLPHLDKVNITGPFNATGVGNTPSRKKIFTCYPSSQREEDTCASEILSNLAHRAYRRPVTEGEVSELMSFYKKGREGQSFDKGIELALRRIISGPEFVFRAEDEPEGIAPGTLYHVSDLELASRLSFFLWSSIPDEKLLSLAEQNKLSNPETLDGQVARMLADPKADALVDNFATEWLALRNLRTVVPDPATFPDFDNNLREGLIRETQLLFRSIIKEDRSVLDLLDADYTFMNQRLARYYGVPGIYGPDFRRVKVKDPNRRGLLGQGSILTLTSASTRTSPVGRGKWVLTNLLDLPPPAPPPNVPSLEASASDTPQTIRQQMTAHRADPVCAACHKLMDPIGFSLENFDGAGYWRIKDNGLPINDVSIAFDGSELDGVPGLRQFLLSKKYVFAETVTKKLLTYALGRPLAYTDMPAVRKIMKQVASDDYRFSSIIEAIIHSEPFLMRISSSNGKKPEVTAQNTSN